MKKYCLVFGVLFLFVVFFTGCSGAAVNKEALGGVRSAGILSLVVKKTGPHSPGNDAVLQAIADYSLGQVQAKLKTVSAFKFVPVSAYYSEPEFRNAGTMAKASGIMAFLNKKAGTDPSFAMGANMSAATDTKSVLRALFSGAATGDSGKAVAMACESGQKTLDTARMDYAVTTGMPFVPYPVFNDGDAGTTSVTYVNGVKQDKKAGFLKTSLIEQVKTVCYRTKLDAMILVYVETKADPPKGVYVITGGNRVLGTIRLNMTMIMIDKNGETITDLGWPSMDDLAPLKMVIPASIAAKWSRDNKMVLATAIDLKDPGGVVLNAFKELVADSSGRMTNDLRKAIGEIE